MFKARTSRTLLTVLGMGVGIAAILFLVSLGYGLQKTLLERITTSDSLLTLDVNESKTAIVTLNQEAVDSIKEMDGVAEISKSFSLSSQAQLDGLSADLIAVVTEPSFLRLGGNRVERGESLSDDYPENIIITSSVVQVFESDVDSIIGKEVNVSFFDTNKEASDTNSLQESTKKVSSDKVYKIAGIIQGEENVIYVNSKTLNDFEVKHYDTIKVKSVTNEKMNIIRDAILEKGFLVSSLSDTVDQANKIFGIIQIILMCFGIIALVVSAIGMFNTMTIALLERTNEIGIMKSIGASDMSISMMFIMEATIMGFLGGLGGVVLGLLGGKLFNITINIIATRLGGQAVNLFYSPLWFIGLIILFAAVVGFLTGVVPARRASKIDPLDALQYK
jgi:putative ABC transport system permease protein